MIKSCFFFVFGENQLFIALVYLFLCNIFHCAPTLKMECPGVMDNRLECDIIVRKLELQSRCYVHFWPNHIYPTPPLGQEMTQGQFLSGV